ncbi:hypothetical protein BC829DRAFT_414532 [Chytridium lagenaria]|nr:hypothetical protein BC829DRAFT_414532 [Chytridium lagenaria]
MAQEEVIRLCSLKTFDENSVIHPPREWLNIALKAMSVNKTHLFEWIINTGKTPVMSIIDPTTRQNLLHEVVTAGCKDLILFLLKHTSVRGLMVQRDANGKLPFELAIEGGKTNIIALFKGYLHELPGVSENGKDRWLPVSSIVQKASHIGATFDELCNEIRLLRLKDLETVVTTGSVITNFEAYSWLSSPRSWPKDAEKILFNLLRGCIYLQPPASFDINAWEDITPVDAAAVGTWYFRRTKVDESQALWEIQRFRNEFHRVWDGKMSTLIPSLRSFYPEKSIRNKEETTEAAGLDILAQLTTRPKSDEIMKGFDNLALMYGAICIARLDLLVECGQIDLLKRLINSGTVDPLVDITPTEEDAESLVITDPDTEDRYLASSSKYLSIYIQCPYCRHNAPITPVGVGFRLRRCIERHHPWLTLDEDTTVEEALLGLAAGLDSIRIFVWLIESLEVNPLDCEFERGDTVLHIAASRGSMLVCLWLCRNGYGDLVDVKNDLEELPWMHAIKSSHPASVGVLHALLSFKTPPPDIVDYINDKFEQTTADAVTEHVGLPRKLAYIRRMFEERKDVDKIITAIFNFGQQVRTYSCVQSLLNLAVEFKRHNVFKGLLCHPMSYEFFAKSTVRDHAALLQQAISSGGADIKRTAIIVKSLCDIGILLTQNLKRYHKCIARQAPLSHIKSTFQERQKLLRDALKVDPEKEFCVVTYTTTKEWVLGGDGMDYFNPLESSIHHNCIETARWILSKSSPSLRDLDDLIDIQRIVDDRAFAKNALRILEGPVWV